MASLNTPQVPGPPRPRFLDQVRHAIRVKHYSIRKEEAYVQWIRRFIVFHGKRHPQELGRQEVEAFLTNLAVEGKVAAATQNQALNALVFLYREIIGRDIGMLQDVVRAKRSIRVRAFEGFAFLRTLTIFTIRQTFCIRGISVIPRAASLTRVRS